MYKVEKNIFRDVPEGGWKFPTSLFLWVHAVKDLPTFCRYLQSIPHP